MMGMHVERLVRRGAVERLAEQRFRVR
jgi:hypothetical protein